MDLGMTMALFVVLNKWGNFNLYFFVDTFTFSLQMCLSFSFLGPDEIIMRSLTSSQPSFGVKTQDMFLLWIFSLIYPNYDFAFSKIFLCIDWKRSLSLFYQSVAKGQIYFGLCENRRDHYQLSLYFAQRTVALCTIFYIRLYHSLCIFSKIL